MRSRVWPPSSAAAGGKDWKSFCTLLGARRTGKPWPWARSGLVRDWYKPQLERLYDAAFRPASGDLEQLEHLSTQHA